SELVPRADGHDSRVKQVIFARNSVSCRVSVDPCYCLSYIGLKCGWAVWVSSVGQGGILDNCDVGWGRVGQSPGLCGSCHQADSDASHNKSEYEQACNGVSGNSLGELASVWRMSLSSQPEKGVDKNGNQCRGKADGEQERLRVSRTRQCRKRVRYPYEDD